MDLGAVGPGPAGANLSRVTGSAPPAPPAMGPVAAGAAETLGDSIAILLNDLSASDIARLIDAIGHPLPVQDTARLQDLLRTISSAAAEGNVTRALSALREVALLDPSRPDILRADPAIESIRAGVDQFLDRYAKLARLDAEGRLEQAGQRVGPSAPERLAGWDMRPETMLLIANRLFESGGLANYVRATELAQLVIDGSRWAPVTGGLPPAAPEPAMIDSREAGKQATKAARQAMWSATGRMAARVRSLWLRAPLLILMLSWLLLGIVGGFGSWLWRRFSPETWPASLVEMAFEVWGSGFLILIALGFFARLRRGRL